MQIRNRKRAARGFTLIELVIVIAVIAILAALLVPTILGQAERARVSRAKSDAAEIAKALARIRADTSFVDAATPTCFTLDNLASVTGPATGCGTTPPPVCTPNDPTTAGLPCWGGPYMSTTPEKDPWNEDWTVAVNVGTQAITVTSGGPDRTIGGSNAADDIIVTQ